MMTSSQGDYVGGTTQGGATQRGMGGYGSYFGRLEGGEGNRGSEMQPYIDAGHDALGQYMKSIGAMQDPDVFMQHLMSGYSMSKNAQLQTQAGITGSNQAAAQSGMLGAGDTQAAIARQSQGIAQSDQQRYINNLMGIHNQYMGGLHDVSGMGERGTAAQMQQEMEQERLAQQKYEYEDSEENKKNADFGKNLIGLGSIAASF